MRCGEPGKTEVIYGGHINHHKGVSTLKYGHYQPGYDAMFFQADAVPAVGFRHSNVEEYHQAQLPGDHEAEQQADDVHHHTRIKEIFSGFGRRLEPAYATFILIHVAIVGIAAGIDEEVQGKEQNNCIEPIYISGLAKAKHINRKQEK